MGNRMDFFKKKRTYFTVLFLAYFAFVFIFHLWLERSHWYFNFETLETNIFSYKYETPTTQSFWSLLIYTIVSSSFYTYFIYLNDHIMFLEGKTSDLEYEKESSRILHERVLGHKVEEIRILKKRIEEIEEIYTLKKVMERMETFEEQNKSES